ncbi:hypothetical protein SDC9_113037 [bioreactor metagenome]|uniref:Uncharacterized protein n=1 Tax=bioreactor metagenome TaxID=1076179 RepID=A0A645BKY2_9ZZZZ
MGVVDNHGVEGRNRHDFDAPSDATGTPEGVRDPAEGNSQVQPAGDGGQGVVDSEAAGDSQMDPADGIHRHRLKFHVTGEEADVLGNQVRLVLVFRISEFCAGGGFGIKPASLVVQIEDGNVALIEKQPLGPSVFLHRAVVIQMILGQVGENARREADAVHPVQGKGVGGDLHHQMGTACVRHTPAQSLDFIGFGGGALSRKGLRADHILVGADKPHLGPYRALQHGFDEVGGGCLPVGAGDTHGNKAPGGMTEPVGREDGEGRARVCGGHPGAFPLRLFFTQHGHGAQVHGLVDKLMPVGLISGQGHKESARRHRTGIIAQ